MFLLLILPILVSGFIVCNTNPYYFPKLHRFEGQLLYLKSAQLGAASLIFFTLIAVSLNSIFPLFTLSIDVISIVMALFEDMIPQSDLKMFSWVATLSVGSIVFAYIWCACSYCWLIHKTIRELCETTDSFTYKELFKSSKGIKLEVLDAILRLGKIKVQGKILSDSPMEKLFFNAFFEKKATCFTLESRKVYVGMILNMGEPTESQGMDQEILIMPIMSGYRDGKTLNVEFDTYYENTEKLLELVIRQDQILSATEFDFDAYEDFILADEDEPEQSELDLIPEPSG